MTRAVFFQSSQKDLSESGRNSKKEQVCITTFILVPSVSPFTKASIFLRCRNYCFKYKIKCTHKLCWAISIFSWNVGLFGFFHYGDVIMSTVAPQITGVSIICSAVCSGADQSKRQSSASLAFVRGIHRSPVDSFHKGPVTRKKGFIWWRHHVFICLVVLYFFCVRIKW